MTASTHSGSMGAVDKRGFPGELMRDSTLVFAETSVMRGDLTDEEWAIIGGLLPPERGRWSRPGLYQWLDENPGAGQRRQSGSASSGYPAGHPAPLEPVGNDRLRFSPLQGPKPHRAHVQPLEAVPPDRHAIRQDRQILPRLPPPCRREAMASILCQQSLGTHIRRGAHRHQDRLARRE